MAQKEHWLPPWEGPGSPQSPVPVQDTPAQAETAPHRGGSQRLDGHPDGASQQRNAHPPNDSPSGHGQQRDDSPRSSAPSENDTHSRHGRETHSAPGRVLSLGTDSQGGYAVPFQLDGVKPLVKKPKKAT